MAGCKIKNLMDWIGREAESLLITFDRRKFYAKS